jgi:hypothetical protein
MALTASYNTSIPRYLRHKAEDTSANDRWDLELDRANKILHDRIVRFHRNELCKGCARFDWLRTHFYTREVRFKKKRDEQWGRFVGNQGPRPLPFGVSGPIRDFENAQDDVAWSHFEVIAGAPQEAVWLAKNPRFHWRLQTDQILRCRLCKSLWNAAGTVPGLVKLRDKGKSPAYLDIELGGGPIFEDGGKYQCIEVSHPAILDIVMIVTDVDVW